MNHEDSIARLKSLCLGRNFELFQDEILMANARIGAEHYQIDLASCTPTFVLKVDQTFLVVIIQGSRKLDFKKLKSYLGTSKVRMASPDEIRECTAAPVGSVSLLNSQLRTLIDANILRIDYCFGGCGIEKFTLKITPQDLIALTQAEIGDFSAARL